MIRALIFLSAVGAATLGAWIAMFWYAIVSDAWMMARNAHAKAQRVGSEIWWRIRTDLTANGARWEICYGVRPQPASTDPVTWFVQMRTRWRWTARARVRFASRQVNRLNRKPRQWEEVVEPPRRPDGFDRVLP